MIINNQISPIQNTIKIKSGHQIGTKFRIFGSDKVIKLLKY
ncbi:hypothetical protein SAMN05444410_110111 [Hydrobacter penzbergensis]|uniref:Uncharacterized protein n=1 Tax=Hydrobacter penzbergensis TaxID=1235997 RepID=A0A8X8IGM6_9BACT|nr:hypothetical protein SAMN05444410_110111 [Hydrobacter penzbergensis]